MTNFLPFHVPDIGQREIDAVVDVLRSGWLTTGPRVGEFEAAFATEVGAPYAVAVNSCTAALHLALEAIGVREGDEVIVPTMTFAATAEVVSYLKARPVLTDCRWDTMNIDAQGVEDAITPRTKAIIPVHFAGHPCEMERILEVARRHDLYVIEDAAHAIPAWYRGRMVGTLGDITCFSFYATKNITTGEGGMATTRNKSWAERMRMMSLHGLSRTAWSRYASTGSWRYDIVSPGYKYNMTDLAAALGLVQLRKCDHAWTVRRRYAALYQEGLKDLDEIVLPEEQPHVLHAWHLYVIRLDQDRLRIGRDEFIEILRKNNIGASVHFIPLHRHPYYQRAFGYRHEDFPIASAAADSALSLPLYPRMSEADVYRVISVVREIVQDYRR